MSDQNFYSCTVVNHFNSGNGWYTLYMVTVAYLLQSLNFLLAVILVNILALIAVIMYTYITTCKIN